MDKSNLRQLHTMVYQYAMDNNEFLPPAYNMRPGHSEDYYDFNQYWCGILFKNYVVRTAGWDIVADGGKAWDIFTCPDVKEIRKQYGGTFSNVGYVYSWMIHNANQYMPEYGRIGVLGREIDEKRVLLHCAGWPTSGLTIYLSAVGAPHCAWMDWYHDALANVHNKGSHFLTVSGAAIWVPDLGSNTAYRDGQNNYIRWW